MKKILIGLTFIFSFSFAETLNLTSGWNLVGINAPLSIDELKTQVGEDNLLVVQGPVKTYQKQYVDADTSFLNDFERFEVGKGYWVKVLNPVGLSYNEPINDTSNYLLSLEEGWNLINAPAALTLSELITQIGHENLLVVQGSGDTYQKSYVESGNTQLNDFEVFSTNSGYWIQVASAINIEFVFNIDTLAVDNSGQALVSNMDFNNTTYSVRVYTNIEPSSEISQSTLAISGTINGENTGATFKLNSSYPLETHFSVHVYNAQNELLAKSDNVKYLTSPIDFGSITFEVPSNNDTESSEEVTNAEFQGVNVFSNKMTYNDYTLESITDSDFNALSTENKWLIASKLYAVLFHGSSKEDLETLINSNTFISTIQTKLATDNTDVTTTENYIRNRDYNWNENNANREKILARLFHLNLGKQYLTRWVAYILTQNIMFSPANELETVDASDILNVYNRLVLLMDDDYSMQMITYLHMTSDDNWKRFRSPEDNGREMLEIFLLDFNDTKVPRAGIALKNWRLNRSDNELVIGLNQNDEPQELFGTTVTTGFDFYRELVKTKEFTKGVTARLVGRYFPQVTDEKRADIIGLIVSSNPNSFQDILLQIIFSKEFLFNSEKVKTVEETTYHLIKSISFYDSLNFFSYMRDYMDRMHQSPMYYKLGRKSIVPVDTLSFANYYDFTRRYVMNDRRNDIFNEWDGGWEAIFIDKSITGTDSIEGLINHVFMSVLAREATSEEMSLLANYAANEARGTYDDMETYNDRLGVTQIVMEYLSRLTELYTLKKIEE